MNKEKLDNIFNDYKLIQNREEIGWLLNKIETEIGKPKVVLEIGIERGGTFKLWNEIMYHGDEKEGGGILIGVDDVNNLIYNLDILKGKVYYILGDSRKKETIDKVEKVLRDNVGRDDGGMGGDDGGMGGDDGGIDYMFIDGGHHYRVVKSDYENYSKFMRKGRKGLIAFHDIWEHDQSTTLQNIDRNDGSEGGVTRFWLEVNDDFIRKNGKYPEVKRIEFMQARSGFNMGIGLLWIER